jgi:hypothetical protein
MLYNIILSERLLKIAQLKLCKSVWHKAEGKIKLFQACSGLNQAQSFSEIIFEFKVVFL